MISSGTKPLTKNSTLNCLYLAVIFRNLHTIFITPMNKIPDVAIKHRYCAETWGRLVLELVIVDPTGTTTSLRCVFLSPLDSHSGLQLSERQKMSRKLFRKKLIAICLLKEEAILREPTLGSFVLFQTCFEGKFSDVFRKHLPL